MVKAFISLLSKGSDLPFMLRSMQPFTRSSMVLMVSSRPRYCGKVECEPTQDMAKGLVADAWWQDVQDRLVPA